MLAAEAERYRQVFNRIRPHEALDMRGPTDVDLTAPPTWRARNLSHLPDAEHPT